MPHSLLQSIHEGLAACGVLDGCVLVGVSGGPDSMALLRGLRTLTAQREELHLHAVHVDHQLRPESSAEAAQVHGWCRTLGVACSVETVSVSSDGPGTGVEEAARKLRYRAFLEHARRLHSRFVAVAHHADDNAETILHHIVRGTGIVGLRGIPPTRQLDEHVRVIRPLLNVARAEILDFLTSEDVDYLEDSSNRDTRFTRNRIRQELLPLLERDFNPQVRSALLRLGSQAAELEDVLQDQLDDVIGRACTIDADQAVVRCDLLSGTPRAVLRSLMLRIWTDQKWPRQKMGFADWDALANLVHSGPGARDMPGGVRAVRRKATLHLKRR